MLFFARRGKICTSLDRRTHLSVQWWCLAFRRGWPARVLINCAAAGLGEGQSWSFGVVFPRQISVGIRMRCYSASASADDNQLTQLEQNVDVEFVPDEVRVAVKERLIRSAIDRRRRRRRRVFEERLGDRSVGNEKMMQGLIEIIGSVRMQLLTENVDEILIDDGVAELIVAMGRGVRRRRLDLQTGGERIVQGGVDVFEHVGLMIGSAETWPIGRATCRRNLIRHRTAMRTTRCVASGETRRSSPIHLRVRFFCNNNR